MKKLIYETMQIHRKKKLSYCGDNVRIGRGCDIRGNVIVKDHVVIGDQCRFVSTRANIIISDHVVFGPEVTIYSGDHRFDLIGKYMIDVKDDSKSPQNDQDVYIESDVWVGTRVIILKGVTIGRGSVIGAGSVVTKSVPPYSIYTGSPLVKVRPRFSEQEISEHEAKLSERETE